MFWVRTNNQFAASAANSAGIVDVLAGFNTAYGADLFGFTITRIVGNMTMTSSDTAPAPPYMWSVGLRVEDGSTIAAVNTDAEQRTLAPDEDPYSDWMYATNRHGFSTSEGNVGLSSGPNRWEIDIRSQRRLDELGQSLYLFTGADLGGGLVETTQLSYDLNVLCKRP